MQSKHFLRNKRVLVTGASGSIGSALCRMITKQKPGLLVLLDQDESGIFDVYEELKDVCNVDYAIASIRDLDALYETFERYKPEYIYHASAYKHVALMEKYPDEAYKTNVEGTRNVINAAHNYAKKFVLISTDKAVNPSCVMGKTKAEAEKICLGANKDVFGRKGKFMVVRFGNVMASRGSLIPIWQKKISENRNLTVTHRSMQRYFMGIYEAVDLVLEASRIGEGGEIFVLDMGDQMKITELAKWMIRMSGKPLEVEYTKPKKGEKFSEELMTKEEREYARKVGNLFVIKKPYEEKS